MQKTIKQKISCSGIGLHTGVTVNITMLPAAEDTGIVFKRTDIKDKNNIVKADFANVTKTQLGTTIANEDNVEISTIEHLMAALWGTGVDNCIIEIDNFEVPIMDGSSEPFIFLIDCAGVIEQDKKRKTFKILKDVKVFENGTNEDDGFIAIAPSDDFTVALAIDFKDQFISKQDANFIINSSFFKSEISRARTFCYKDEVDYMRSIGLARGGSLDNAIVVDKQEGVVNEGGLRYKNEFVKHKILDCIGDIFLAGGHFKGKITGYKSGHKLNNMLLRAIFADSDNYSV